MRKIRCKIYNGPWSTACKSWPSNPVIINSAYVSRATDTVVKTTYKKKFKPVEDFVSCKKCGSLNRTNPCSYCKLERKKIKL